MAGLVIVGAGECGMRAAFAARDAGYVGAISVIGEELEMPYERPSLSKPDQAGVVGKAITSLEALSERSVHLRTGVTVTGLSRTDRAVQLSDGTSLSYERVLLATGARPRPLVCPGGENARVLRTIGDARAIYGAAGPGTRVVIVGAGLIGLELAAELCERRAHVTVLEAGPRPLGRNVPERLAARIAARHKEKGVEITCGTGVASCTDKSVSTEDGRVLDADLVVAAIGVEANTDLAAAAGLPIRNGICVQGTLATEDPLIFAAGDCAAVKMTDGSYRRFETWQNAQVQGDVAGRNLAGGDARFDVPVWFWSDQYDLGLQGVGDTSGAPTTIRVLSDGAEILFYMNEQGALIGAAGLGYGNALAKDIKIAQRLIGSKVDATLLCDPSQNMKKLLRAA